MEYYPFDLSMPRDIRVVALKQLGGRAWACSWYELLATLYQMPRIPVELTPALSSQLGMEPDECEHFLDACVEVGLLDKGEFAEGTITNDGVVRRKAISDAKSKAGKAGGRPPKEKAKSESTR